MLFKLEFCLNETDTIQELLNQTCSKYSDLKFNCVSSFIYLKKKFYYIKKVNKKFSNFFKNKNF